MSVTGHHHIHTCSLLQVRVEIETEYHLLGILSNGIIHFSRVQFGFKVHLVQFRIEITGYLVAHMVEYHHKETTRTTSRVEHTTILVGIKHLNHTFDNITRCKELTSRLLQRVAYDGFIGCTLHVNRSIKERILCQFTCYKSKTTVGESNLLTAIEHILKDMTVLQILEDSLDSLSNSMLTFWSILFFHTHPKTTAITDALSCIREATFLVIELAEYQVEKFPKSSFLHTLVTIDIIMTTLKGLDKRFIGRFTWHSSFSLFFKIFKCLSLGRKIRNWLTGHLSEIIFKGMYILQVFTVCPTGELAICSTQNIFCCSLNTSLFIGWLHFGIFCYNDKAD